MNSFTIYFLYHNTLSPMPVTEDGQFFRIGEDSDIQAIFALPAQADNETESTAEQSPIPNANVS